MADNSIEIIVSNGGPVNILQNKESVDAVVQEIKRVLKPGGEARIGTGWNVNVFEDESDKGKDENTFEYFRRKWGEYLKGFGFSAVEIHGQSEAEEIEDDRKMFKFYIRLIK